ncbi:MAG: rhodanese-like domain-containing protein [Pigmentiphaga sp.]|nr:rhodanese-like domain-containing protein [Pigmentiphaga sp.]
MSFLLENIFIALVAVISGAMLAWPALSRTRGVKGIDIPTATRLVNQEHAVFVDVRPADDYAKGHIPQARNLPIDQIESRAQTLPKNKPLIVVCADGRSAGRAVAHLQAKGFDKTVALTEGLNAWRKADLPLATR